MNSDTLLLWLGMFFMLLCCTGCWHSLPKDSAFDRTSQQRDQVESKAAQARASEEEQAPEEIPFKSYPKTSVTTELDKSIYQIMEKYQIVGMQAAVVVGDSIVWNGAYGWFDLHKEIPLGPDHSIRIASVSKSLVGLAAMRLVHEWKLDLHEDINTYLKLSCPIRNPYHPEAPITTKQLMNHTSSILNGQYVEYVVASRAENPVTYTLMDYFGENGEFNKPENWSKDAPGEKFSYSNMGTIVLGAVIERLSGQPFSAYVQQEVLECLRMHHSTFNPIEFKQLRVATMYKRQEKDREVCFGWTPAPVGGSYKDYVPGSNGGLHSPQGGLVSNALDLSQFVLAMTSYGRISGKQVFPGNVIDTMHHPSVNITTAEKEPGELYKKKGLCIHITEDHIPGYTFYGHSGNAYGIISHVYYTMNLPKNFGFAIIFNGCNMIKRENRPFRSIEEDMTALLYELLVKEAL